MVQILLLTGGASPERDVSLESKKFFLSCIDQKKFNIISVTIEKDKTWIFDENNEICHLLKKNNSCLF